MALKSIILRSVALSAMGTSPYHLATIDSWIIYSVYQTHTHTHTPQILTSEVEGIRTADTQ